MIAVGTRYNTTQIPSFGPVPQEGRIWHSTDGVTWDDITPRRTFADASLFEAFVDHSDRVVVIGTVDDGRSELPMAWQSTDGISWKVAADGSVPPGYVGTVEQGAVGYAALTSIGAGTEAWISADGEAWQRSITAQPEGWFSDIGAGAEGFVITGARAPNQDIVLASSDGVRWFESADPPPAALVAPMGGDWFAVGRGLADGNRAQESTPVWFSANGLDWEQVGEHPLVARPVAAPDCPEWVGGLHHAGGVLVTGTFLRYPCGEGRGIPHATQRMSLDGASWETILEPGASGASQGAIFATGEHDGAVVLVGKDGAAASFWMLR
ncbi:MAG TPA: hypothetical protein VF114_07740 [Candidatus Limnocylindria bacterium]